MAPRRRGGEGGAGAQVALASGRSVFEPAPLKRMSPWQQDGAGQCDIIAGGVDESGIFKGVNISGVHIMALLRTFQLSKVFMPVDTPVPVAALGQNLQDGIPVIVVTRGCFGRDMDYGPGPVRNDVQKTVWEICRSMRAEMPQVLITCIDIPINCGTDVVQACLDEPLNMYRELMYHEGTWYTPAIFNASSLASWKAEHRKEKLGKFGGGGVKFARKKFGWIDENQFYSDIHTVGWKPVLEVKPAPTYPRRTDLSFVDAPRSDIKPIQDSTPSGAEATFRKLLARARESADPSELLSSAKAYLNRAKFSERLGLEEAVKACTEAAQLYESRGEAMEACTAKSTAVGAYIYMNEIDKALQMAADMQASAKDPKIQVKAARLTLDCHFALGDLDKALEAAKSVKESLQKTSDPEAVCEAWGLVVNTEIAQGDLDAAIASAKQAAGVADKASKAKALRLLADAHMAMASQTDAEAAKLDSFDEAAKAQQEARALFKDLGKKKDEADALEAAANILLLKGDATAALGLATELQDFPDGAGAMGSQLVASAHLSQYGKDRSFLQGGQEAMLTAAHKAVASFQQLGQTARIGGAQRVLLQARRASHGSL
mmetsp:Transcript_37449/g.94145  ORF Transcript_37449/g.94145 Transcript_37449/m.94145 type:complete len:603 (+) Transcript_37449:81-1889(+)